MPRGYPINPEIKNSILKAVHDEGMSPREAGETFGVNPKTIESWIFHGVEASEKSYIAQIKQLQKKLDNAYRVIGELSVNTPRPKN